MFGKSKSTLKMVAQIQVLIKQPNFSGNIIFVWFYSILIFIFVGLSSSASAQQSKIDSLLTVLDSSQPDTNKVKTLYFLSQTLNGSKPDIGLVYAKQGLELSRQLKFKRGQSISLNALALSYYQLGKFDSAMINFEKRFEIVSEMKDSIGIAGVFDNLSVMYVHRGEIDNALELRLKANKIYSANNKRL